MYLHCLFHWASVRRRRRHHTSTNFEKKKVQKKAKLKRGERRFGSETDEVMEGMRGRMEGWKKGRRGGFLSLAQEMSRVMGSETDEVMEGMRRRMEGGKKGRREGGVFLYRSEAGVYKKRRVCVSMFACTPHCTRKQGQGIVICPSVVCEYNEVDRQTSRRTCGRCSEWRS